MKFSTLPPNIDRTTAEVAASQIFLLFVLPITLLYFGVVPISMRIPVLLTVALLMYGIIKKQKWTARDLGISLKTIRPGLPLYIIWTVIGALAIVLLSRGLGMEGTDGWWKNPHFLFVFLALSFFQEFAFRGFLMPILRRVFPDTFTIILVNALLFSGMHAIYPLAAIGLPVTFVGGLLWASLYNKYPNLILVTASHAVLNFIIVWYGFFTIG